MVVREEEADEIVVVSKDSSNPYAAPPKCPPAARAQPSAVLDASTRSGSYVTVARP